MSSSRDALRRQRRRELDAKRSKSRVRLGASLQSWGQLKERLGFTLHSELAQYLLESYFSRVCVKCSAGVREGVKPETLVTSADSLQHLVMLVHRHGQHCPFPPTLHDGAAGNGRTVRGDEEGVVGGEPSLGKKEGLRLAGVGCSVGLTKEQLASQPLANVLGQSGDGSATALDLRYTCDGGHLFSWCPYQTGREGMSEGGGGFEKGGGAPVELNRSRERGRRGRKRAKKQAGVEGAWSAVKAGRCSKVGLPVTREGSQQPEEDQGEEEEVVIDLRTTEIEENRRGDECGQEVESETGSDTMLAENLPPLGDGQLPDNEEKDMNTASHKHKNGGPALKRDSTVVLPTTTRGRRRKEVQSAADRGSPSTRERENRRTARGLTDDDISQIGGKRKRKATPRDILPCEFVGCGKIFSTRQYLNHHMKYQHVQQKTFACSHPACGKSFNFKKHLKEHEKLHSNQRDYICEFCARAFRTSSNLIIHRRIHTGEKPLQCEVCGFTCRQKASLNWHMRKHDAESGYQFPCEICGRRFEKRDNVTAHRSKSHPDRATSPLPSRG